MCNKNLIDSVILKASNYLNQKQSESLINDCEEIIRIITKIQKTMKS